MENLIYYIKAVHFPVYLLGQRSSALDPVHFLGQHETSTLLDHASRKHDPVQHWTSSNKNHVLETNNAPHRTALRSFLHTGGRDLR